MDAPIFPGLIFSVNLDGQGGEVPIPEVQIRTNLSEDRPTWVHLDYSAAGINDWLSQVAELDQVAVEALTADDPRPRCFRHGEGLILILRGVNLNPGADREDMVSIRIWLDARGVISMRQRKLMAPPLVRDKLKQGIGPTDTGELIVMLNDTMCEFISNVITDLDESMDNLEEAVMTQESQNLRKSLSQFRMEAITIRRYLAPQREALASLQTMQTPWMNELQRLQMREITDRTIRYIEDLDAMRERSMVMHEELTGRIAERMNRTMYFISIVTGIFLPLGLLTGLLGINVGGMPGAETPAAFWVVCGLLGTLVIIQLWLFKKMKWL